MNQLRWSKRYLENRKQVITYENFSTYSIKNLTKDKLPLEIRELKTGNSIIKRKSSVKFQRVMPDENISWKDHIKTIEKNYPNYWFIT